MGETNILKAKDELINILEDNNIQYTDSIKVLPDYLYKYGIINNICRVIVCVNKASLYL